MKCVLLTGILTSLIIIFYFLSFFFDTAKHLMIQSHSHFLQLFCKVGNHGVMRNINPDCKMFSRRFAQLFEVQSRVKQSDETQNPMENIIIPKQT